MFTATAPAISRTEEAARLRTEGTALTAEIAEFQKKLENSQRTLATLQDKKAALAEAAADGKPAPASKIGEICAAIAEAEMPVNALQRRICEKQAALDSARDTLRDLEREIAVDARQAARHKRFASLESQGREIVTRIAAKLESLIAEDLPALDSVRDSLTSEFVNLGSLNMDRPTPEANAARTLIHELEGHFFDGAHLRASRALLRRGWTERGDIKLPIVNLRPPRQ